MNKSEKLLIGYLVLVSLFSVAQNNDRGKRAINVTPNEIQEKFLKWDKAQFEEKSSLVRMGMTRADTWQYSYSQPIDGFLLPKKGEKVNGKIILHKRWNKESPAETVEDVRIIQKDGKDDLYSTNDIILYGINFTIKDWLPEKYVAGYVQFEDGPLLEGWLMLLPNIEQPYPDLHYFQSVYFTQDKTAPVEIFSPKGGAIGGLTQVTQVGQVMGGKTVVYSVLNGSLIDRERWIHKLETDPKKMKTDPLSPGEMRTKNGSNLKGRFAFNTGNKKTYAFFVDEELDVYQVSPYTKGIRVIEITQATGTSTHYVPLKGKFVNSDIMIADLEKDKELRESHLVLTDGRKLDGRSSFETAQNVVKSYRVPLSIYFVSSGADSFLEQFWPAEIDYLEQVVDGKRIKYVPLPQKGFASIIKLEEYLSALESQNFKDPTRNLQNGYVIQNNGQKLEGRIAQGRSNFTFVSTENKLEIYSAANPVFSYFIQSINGIDRRFISQEHGIRAFSGSGYEITEVLQPFGKFSFYRNAKPTHLKKGLTGLAKGAINTVTDAGRVAAANEVAKQEVKEELQNSGGGSDAISSAAIAGAESQAETLELTEGMIDVDDEGGIYHKEWIIVNNNSNEKIVVYKDNDTEVLNDLLKSCSKFQLLSKKEVMQLTDIDNLEDAVKFLNSCNP